MSPVDRHRRTAPRSGAWWLKWAGALLAVGATAWHFPAGTAVEAVALAATETADEGAASSPVESAAAAPETGKLVGYSSCTLSACHGRAVAQPRNDQPRMDELSVWLGDPHAKAYRVLFGSESIAILERLGALVEGQMPPDSENPVWQNCLKCHNPAATVASSRDHLRSEGVSCEACHGAGQAWIHQHWRTAKDDQGHEYRPFRSMSRSERDRLGFIDTKDLFVRAETCAKCHVGQSGGDVNHDLIAAGHPMLAFELSAYQRLLPPHWHVEREQKLWGDSDTREIHQLKLWLGGQMATAGAALELLKLRTGQPATWPEFSEHECFTCHHELADDGRWRADRGFAFAPPEDAPLRRIVAPWRTWNLGLLEEVLAVDGLENPAVVHALASLQTAMQSRVCPDRRLVNTAVVEADRRFDEWYARFANADAPSLGGVDVQSVHDQLLLALMKPRDSERQQLSGERAVHSWERAAHLYFALAANVADDEHPPQRLVDLHKLLSEDPAAKSGSPTSFRGSVGDNLPEHSQREEIRQLLLKLIPP